MENHQRLTLSDQTAVIDSSNLRDLLRLRDEEDRRGETLTLGSVLGCTIDKREITTTNRTLLDIIRAEEEALSNGPGPNKVNWKGFKDRLRLRRAGAAWSSAGQYAETGFPVRPEPRPDRGSTSYVVAVPSPDPVRTSPNLVPSVTAAQQESTTVAEVEPVRMSLMALLEQTDRVRPPVSSVVEVGGGGGGGEEEGGEVVCCVCMVRHKGAAFIPCGHTFCRLCSRELLVSRGNCPLCNGYILEILDIF